ncbi:Gfo/Idh/MocA family oxidoreductase [Paenibacillus frigoriresistens]|uniref:Gfo/Idh/MocA family protein n=1 Tax=Paenibacillus alginolyticus TaxID=59839 RepID=UPI0015632805|nr:Gfo/Idh/MocA family oxidoreductase [Paenibacillus frigoriresistens]NRF95755.1 Gfo/Idh/MocA family oxidoreductase [Paenibacillus frigoriresistens]
MEKNINVCIFGAGNISNTRHIPALKKISSVTLHGVMSDREKNIERTLKKYKIPHSIVIKDTKNNLEKLENTSWFKDVDAVVIGAPPKEHYPLVKLALLLDKHVLVEKPMMMNKEECDELIELAKFKNKHFCVMHNFQYASKMMKLNKIIESKLYGDIVSITELQFTNRYRRLPEWYNDLPLGLFYDEAAHFIYLLERHGGSVKINNVYATFNENEDDSTPILLNVTATAGIVPVQIMLNFNAPICEWYYVVNFKERILIYDFFKDILINLPTDNEHYAKDILRNSIKQTLQYWTQFAINGFKMVTGNLLYGHDKTLYNFIEGIRSGRFDSNITAENGRNNVIVMNEIVGRVNK